MLVNSRTDKQLVGHSPDGVLTAIFCGLVGSNSFATPWNIACQAPCPRNSPDKNTVVGCHFLLQGIILTQGLNSHLLDQQAGSLPLNHQGSPLTAIRINKLSHAVTDRPVQNQAKLCWCQKSGQSALAENSDHKGPRQVPLGSQTALFLDLVTCTSLICKNSNATLQDMYPFLCT